MTPLARLTSHLKDVEGGVIDYVKAATGHLKIVPTHAAKAALEEDYAAMQTDEIMIGNSAPFSELLEACAEIETMTNQYIPNEAKRAKQSNSQPTG